MKRLYETSSIDESSWQTMMVSHLVPTSVAKLAKLAKPKAYATDIRFDCSNMEFEIQGIPGFEGTKFKIKDYIEISSQYHLDKALFKAKGIFVEVFVHFDELENFVKKNWVKAKVLSRYDGVNGISCMVRLV